MLAVNCDWDAGVSGIKKKSNSYRMVLVVVEPYEHCRKIYKRAERTLVSRGLGDNGCTACTTVIYINMKG